MYWSNNKHVFGGLLLICIICTLYVLFVNKTNEENLPIRCISNYVIENISKEEKNYFINLEGIEIWEAWSDLTSDFSDDYFILEECDLFGYVSKYSIDMDTLRGKMIFVFSVHYYMKNGQINYNYIVKEVDKIMADED